jgi:ubiquinone/menaquinone biosynthesis C-methylase UbiE
MPAYGTGRALPSLRQAAGPHGTVIAADLTPEMLRHARARSGAANAVLIWGDARQLPLASGSADAVFAAGLVNHMPDPEAGLRELARVTRPGGLLIVFHPSGRPALAGTPAARSRISRRSPG